MRDLYEAQRRALVCAFAGQLGCAPAAFAQEELLITARPEPPAWPFSLMIATFGTGTVVCAEDSYLDWFRGSAPRPHHVALNLPFRFVSEARRRGDQMEAHAPSMGWALDYVPDRKAVPNGLRLERKEREWMNALQAQGAFENAVGHAAQVHRTFRNRFAYALIDEDGEPVAVAGVFDTPGVMEIGVDVARAHRGRGLAPLVVGAATEAVLDSRGIPFYACGVGNIRSQRTALASGFSPALSTAAAVRIGTGT